LRKRLSYINEKLVLPLLETAATSQINFDDLKYLACNARSWTDFYEIIVVLRKG